MTCQEHNVEEEEEEKKRQQGTGKGDRREKASVILKLELSAWETQGLRWKWAPGFQVDRKELTP